MWPTLCRLPVLLLLLLFGGVVRLPPGERKHNGLGAMEMRRSRCKTRGPLIGGHFLVPGAQCHCCRYLGATWLVSQLGESSHLVCRPRSRTNIIMLAGFVGFLINCCCCCCCRGPRNKMKTTTDQRQHNSANWFFHCLLVLLRLRALLFLSCWIFRNQNHTVDRPNRKGQYQCSTTQLT